MINVSLVDDHVLLRNGLAAVVDSFDGYTVVFEADNGKHFIEQLSHHKRPHLVLLDISMPVMDGFETAKWINEHAPDIKVLVLSMIDKEEAIIRMLKEGVRGFILKDSKPHVLRQALDEVMNKGFFLNNVVSGQMLNILREQPEQTSRNLTEKEISFLKLCCSEKSYKEIADEMNISLRAAEALRSGLFEKIDTPSRVGLVLYAIRKGYFKV